MTTLSRQRVCRDIEKLVDAILPSIADLITFQFDYPEIVSRNGFRRRLYICNDDFPLAAKGRLQRWLRQRKEDRVAQRADLCLGVSKPLVRKLASRNRNTRLFLPGHEFDIDLDNDLRHLPCEPRSEIRVCFMGFVNDRLDFEWLSHIARAPNIVVRLIGPVSPSVKVNALLENNSVSVLPVMEGARLRNALMGHDVLIMPYDLSQAFTRIATAPNKLFQYLASARPIVISDMQDFIDLPQGFLYKAASAEEFLSQIRRAYAEDNYQLRLARLKYAKENSWDVRGRLLCEVLSATSV